MLQSKYPMNAPGIIATTIDDSLSEYPVRLDYVEINKILMQARWYDEVEFLVVTAGSIKVQCGDDTYVVEAGDALLFAPGLLHITRPADTKQETYMYRILFSPNFLFNYDEPYLMQKYCYPLLNSPDFKVHSFTRARPEDHQILDYLSQVIEVNFHPIFAYELQTRSYLTHIWMLLSQRIGYSSATDQKRTALSIDNVRMKGALSFIQQHYAEPLTLEQIAESIHISKSECCRCFKRSLNLTPFEYLMKYRVFVACRQIVEDPGLKSLSDLGQSVGFNYSSYFNKVFRKYMNCTPSEYRKRVREEKAQMT